MVDQKGTLRDLSGHISDIDPDVTAPNGLARLQEIDPTDLPTITGDFNAILSNVRRIFCIGLNYSDHAKESNLPIPEHPNLFMKTCPASRANDPITIPNGPQKTDWEVELGIMIGSEAELSKRMGRPVDQGKILRHLRARGAMAGHKGRNSRSAEPEYAFRCQWDALPNGQHRDNDFSGTQDHLLPQRFCHPTPRRHYHHWHPARCGDGDGDETAEVSTPG